MFEPVFIQSVENTESRSLTSFSSDFSESLLKISVKIERVNPTSSFVRRLTPVTQKRRNLLVVVVVVLLVVELAAEIGR
jgi:hypothetical protein